MPLQETQADPSMEEILASIRRIISEEDTAEPGSPLELGAQEEPEEAAFEPQAVEPNDDLMVFDDEDEPAVEAPAPQPRVNRMEPPAEAPSFSQQPSGEDILSEPARAAAAGAFARLSGALRLADAPGQTLEGLVREMLRPMLREWLDANLPAIVEAQVEAELNRIARLNR